MYRPGFRVHGQCTPYGVLQSTSGRPENSRPRDVATIIVKQGAYSYSDTCRLPNRTKLRSFVVQDDEKNEGPTRPLS